MIDEQIFELILETILVILGYCHILVYIVYLYNASKAFGIYKDIEEFHPEKISGSFLERCRAPYEVLKCFVFSFAAVVELYTLIRGGTGDDGIIKGISIFLSCITLFVVIDFLIYLVAMFRTEDEVHHACKCSESADIIFIIPSVLELVLTFVV